MTPSISIANRKPRSKRTAKGLILTGADSKRARRDGRQEQHEKVHANRPAICVGTAIAESLEGDLTYWGDLSDRSHSRKSRRSVYTSESPNFVCPRPTKRRRIRSVARSTKPVVPTSTEPAQYDEAGRPIVYVSDSDAWNLRTRR